MNEVENSKETKTLRFLRSKSPYTIGEVATFPVDKADFFIERRIAKQVKPRKDKQIHSNDGGKGYQTKS